MFGSDRTGALAVLLAVAAWTGCRGPSELTPPTPEERAAIVKAVHDYLPEGPGSTLELRDEGAEATRTLQGVRTGRVGVVRSRLYRVEGEGTDAEGRRHPIRFYVLQSGPVFVVDTVLIPAPGRPGYAP